MTAIAHPSARGEDVKPKAEVIWDDGSPVVWLQGEHDAFTAADVSEALELAQASVHGDVVVDVSGVQFMGAATVRIIMRTRARLIQADRSLVLRSPSCRTLRVLDLCGFGPAITDG